MNLDKKTSYRVALDLGSGSIKMQSAWIDPNTNTISKREKIKSLYIPLRESIDENPESAISGPVLTLLMQGIEELLENAHLPGIASDKIAVATEVFRVASNGKEILKELEKRFDIKISCISHKEEAWLGRKALEAEGKLLVEDDRIAWEIGGGSTQITSSSKEEVFLKQLGKTPIKNYIITQIQQKNLTEKTSPNPISKQDSLLAIDWIEKQLSDAPFWLRQKVKKNPCVLGMGGMFPAAHSFLKKTVFSKEEIFSLLQERVEKADHELLEETHPIHLVSDFIFLYATMKALEIESVEFAKLTGPGNTSGLLTLDTKHFF
jgi:exopolyphosphatase/pppGpp-phosphohydrolase